MADPADSRASTDASLPGLLGATSPFDQLPAALLERLCALAGEARLRAGETLFSKGERGDTLYVVRAGRLSSGRVGGAGDPAEAVEYGPGALLGEVQMLIGGRRVVTVEAVSDCALVTIDKAALETLAREAPQLVVALGDPIRKRLRKEQLERVLRAVFGEMDAADLREIEGALEWVELGAGETLFEQGAPSESMYFAISGRLVGLRDDGRGPQPMVEIGRGESIGEMGFFTNEPRSATIVARRPSHLVRFLRPAFERLSGEHPKAMLYITQLLISRLRRASGIAREQFEHSNIVILPLGGGAQVTAFTERLVEALHAHGRTLYVSAPRLDEFIGVPGFAQTPADSPLDLALEAGLDDREMGYDCAVYECDAGDTAWTRRALARADRILLVGEAGADPRPDAAEQALLTDEVGASAARRTLLLLHADDADLPADTRHWLAARRVESHHHLRLGRAADYARLARVLTGNAIGVVLGGGGARGFAHLGVLRALREAGIPIDLIGGTSMGALIGVQPALGWDDAKMMRVNRRAFVDNKPVTFRDYTFPAYALVDSSRLEQNLIGPFGDTRIEDLWTGYFCVSSNLSRAEAVVHREGPVWRAVRASISVPGVFAPVLVGNDLLVDGGVLNNLPGDVMRQLGGGWVIAVDVSVDRELEVPEDALPSPWRMLLDWLNPFRRRTERPNIVNMMIRTTLLASVQRTEGMKQQVDLYVQPPVGKFGMMQFRAFEAIADAGYAHARAQLAAWLEATPEVAKLVKAGT
ncbi:MAG TPA: cyclic nucleotide-binding and patatin-like phospholipase domain-containing protein [Burkholderiales bacterium]